MAWTLKERLRFGIKSSIHLKDVMFSGYDGTILWAVASGEVDVPRKGDITTQVNIKATDIQYVF